MSKTTNLFEIFSSVQGEGIHVGRRQLFVRFSGCNLACEHCDTPESRQSILFAHAEHPPGSGRFELVSNPVSTRDLAGRICRMDDDGAHHSISLTGGEPLLCADFIAELIPLCGGRRFYLETNGTLPRELEKVVGLLHTVAMDIKLRSVAGQATDVKTVRGFLSVASQSAVFVKVVVGDRTTDRELVAAAQVVAKIGPNIPFVIQPVTPTSAGPEPPTPEAVLGLQASALAVLEDVRVIPQVHRLMGQK